MPQQRGRKKRPRDRDRRRASAIGEGAAESDGRPAAPTTHAPARPPAPATGEALPSATARATGFMLALVTAVGAAVLVSDGLTGDLAPVDATARVIGGVGLIIIALIVGALSVSPATVRDAIRAVARRRRR